MRFTGILILLFAVLTAAASPRKADMAIDAERIANRLAQYGGFEEWSDALQPLRETFRQKTGMTLPGPPMPVNFAEVLKSIHVFCEEYGMDFIAVRIPTAEERAFFRQNRVAPEPCVYRIQQELLKMKVEFVEPLADGTKPLARRLQERYAPEWTGRKVLICGDPADFPGIAADFLPLRNGGVYAAAELPLLKPEILRSRPAFVLAVPAALLSREMALMQARELRRIPQEEYVPVNEWGRGSWTKLGYEPLPDRDSPYFRILPDGLLQLAPLLEGADSGMAGTMILPLPDPPGKAVRIVLVAEGVAEMEVHAFCGRDTAVAGMFPEGTLSQTELRLRPVSLSRIIQLKFYLKGKVRLKAIRLYRAP